MLPCKYQELKDIQISHAGPGFVPIAGLERAGPLATSPTTLSLWVGHERHREEGTCWFPLPFDGGWGCTVWRDVQHGGALGGALPTILGTNTASTKSGSPVIIHSEMHHKHHKSALLLSLGLYAPTIVWPMCTWGPYAVLPNLIDVVTIDLIFRSRYCI